MVVVVVVALSNALFSVDVTHTHWTAIFSVAVELSIIWKVVMLTACSDSASSLLESVSLAEREPKRSESESAKTNFFSVLYIARPFLTAAAAVNCFVAVCVGTDKQATDRVSEEANSPPSSPAVAAADALGGEQ